jgi:hypothetical protein
MVDLWSGLFLHKHLLGRWYKLGTPEGLALFNVLVDGGGAAHLHSERPR